MKAFLDANVLFSAAYAARSTARRLWTMAERRGVALVTSRLAIEEAVRYLEAKSPASLADLADLVFAMEIADEVGAPDPAWDLDAENAILLAAAIVCGATHFITGDKHFRPLTNRAGLGIQVSTIREFLSSFEEEMTNAG